MTLAGSVLMTASMGTVLTLPVSCHYRVLFTPRAQDRMHAPLDIDTHDFEG
jgi:hypothetical protein